MVTNYKKLILLGIGVFALSIAPIQAMSGWSLFQRGVQQFKSAHKPFSSTISKRMMSFRSFNSNLFAKKFSKNNFGQFDKMHPKKINASSTRFVGYAFTLLGVSTPFYYLHKQKAADDIKIGSIEEIQQGIGIDPQPTIREIFDNKVSIKEVAEKSRDSKVEESVEVFNQNYLVEQCINKEVIENNYQEFANYLKEKKGMCDSLLQGWLGYLPFTDHFKSICEQYADLFDVTEKELQDKLYKISKNEVFISYMNETFAEYKAIAHQTQPERLKFCQKCGSEFAQKIKGHHLNHEVDVTVATFFVHWFYWYGQKNI